MPNGLNDNSDYVQEDGTALILDFKRIDDTTGTLTWTIPTRAKAYDGVVITVALHETNPSNFPTNGVRYTASSDLSSSADRIGDAQVVVAVYNDTTTVTMPLTGLVADTVYYFSAHIVSNVLTYYTLGVRSYPQDQNMEIFAGDIPVTYDGPPLDPVVGQVYYDQPQKTVYFWDGTAWNPTLPSNVITGQYDPVTPFVGLPLGYPKLGDFFYNTRTQMLRSWNGTGWIDAESLRGQPTYQKPNVGTLNEYTARSNLINVLKHQLGYPVVCVELNENHFNIAINNALMEIRRRIDTPYSKQFYFLTVQPNQDVYYLNDPSVGTDRIVDVLKIHRLNTVGLGNFTPDNIYAQQFLTQFYAPGLGYDLVSIHLVSAMAEMYSQLFANDIGFNWREFTREMRIYRRLGRQEKVLIETTTEKTEQEILLDRWMQQWVQQWAESELMLMLGQIRGKFATLPGPGGSLSLNADTLLAEGQRLQDDCLRQVRDMEVGQNGPDNWNTPFVIG